MSRNYSLNPQSASEAGAAQYISETGKYIGKFTRAEIVTSRQGTDGIELDFVSHDGLKANYLQLWTFNASGKELPSLKVLNAIMAVFRLKTIEPTKVSVMDRDGSKRAAEVFQVLMDKPIGLLLQREEYTKADGSSGYKFNIVAPFDAQSELTAGEILKRVTQPEQLAKMVAVLRDKAPRAGAVSSFQPAQSAGAFEDDQIPF